MYCSTCGSLINKGLNYCNRCGARVDKLVTVEKSSVTYLPIVTGLVGLGGLGLTIGLIALLLKSGVVIEAVVMLALAFLVTIFGISFMMLRQISQISRVSLPVKETYSDLPQITQTPTAQLEEPYQPARSITENTTRTLEKELVK